MIAFDYEGMGGTDYTGDFETEAVTTTYSIALPLDDYPDLSQWSLRFANRKRARMVLREGLFLRERVAGKCFPAPGYWRRSGRCDRKGIGLRIRKDR